MLPEVPSPSCGAFLTLLVINEDFWCSRMALLGVEPSQSHLFWDSLGLLGPVSSSVTHLMPNHGKIAPFAKELLNQKKNLLPGAAEAQL